MEIIFSLENTKYNGWKEEPGSLVFYSFPFLIDNIYDVSKAPHSDTVVFFYEIYFFHNSLSGMHCNLFAKISRDEIWMKTMFFFQQTSVYISKKKHTLVDFRAKEGSHEYTVSIFERKKGFINELFNI